MDIVNDAESSFGPSILLLNKGSDRVKIFQKHMLAILKVDAILLHFVYDIVAILQHLLKVKYCC